MFELRWIIRSTPGRGEVSPGSYGGQMMDVIRNARILQYRQIEVVVRDHNARREWSAWQDVPNAGNEEELTKQNN